jgi:preprotein translocase subunit SecG
MTVLFVILIIIACLILGLLVLVQNPKGGGLAGNIAGFSNQFMGVKQTTDVLEKGTWIFAALIVVLCITSTFFMSGGSEVQDRLDNIGTGPLPMRQNTTNPNTTTLPGAQQNQVLPADSNK